MTPIYGYAKLYSASQHLVGSDDQTAKDVLWAAIKDMICDYALSQADMDFVHAMVFERNLQQFSPMYELEVAA